MASVAEFVKYHIINKMRWKFHQVEREINIVPRRATAPPCTRSTDRESAIFQPRERRQFCHPLREISLGLHPQSFALLCSFRIATGVGRASLGNLLACSHNPLRTALHKGNRLTHQSIRRHSQPHRAIRPDTQRYAPCTTRAHHLNLAPPLVWHTADGAGRLLSAEESEHFCPN